MSADVWLVALDWSLRLAGLGAASYCVWSMHRALVRMPTPADVERWIDWRLMELLPLPYLGDRGTLIELLRNVAPGRSRAVFILAETPLLLARDGGWDAPTPADAPWIERHRVALARGEHVHDDRAGVLLPFLTRGGRLAGALVISGTHPVPLDDDARAALRCVAGWLDRAVLADAGAREHARRDSRRPAVRASAPRSTS